MRLFLSQGEKPLFPALFQCWLLDDGGFGWVGEGSRPLVGRDRGGSILARLGLGWFIEEVGFSLETGDGYFHCFSGYREVGGFQNEWGT